MFPYEPDGKTFWPKNKATAKYREIFAAAREELMARDKSLGIPEDGAVCFTTDKGGQKVMQVDPRLAAVKHSGDELHALAQSRWDEFCESPRDSGEFLIKRTLRTKRTPIPETFPTPSLPEAPMGETSTPQVRPRLKRQTSGMIG